jgi:hypothetical protein
LSVVVPGPIGKDRGIQQFPAAGTFPGIKRANKIIEFFGEHATFATWTMHRIPPESCDKLSGWILTSIVPKSRFIYYKAENNPIS